MTAVNVTPDADAPSGAALTIDAATYQVTADVVESDVASIHQGQAAAVSIAAIGADLTGNCGCHRADRRVDRLLELGRVVCGHDRSRLATGDAALRA